MLAITIIFQIITSFRILFRIGRYFTIELIIIYSINLFIELKYLLTMGLLDLFSVGEASDDVKLLPIQFQSIYKTPYKALGLDVV